MSIWTTTQDASRIALSSDVAKTRVTTIILNANGLMPSSSYTFWCNGVDMTWACRTPGTRMGAGLKSDASGSMKVLFLVEIGSTYNSSNGGGSTKYHSMSLRDLNGNIKSLSVVPQALMAR